MNKLIADSGATKTEWCLLHNGRKKTIFTGGISPYFLNKDQIVSLLKKELVPAIKRYRVEEINYYGTGCAAAENAQMVKKAIGQVFKDAKIKVTHDLEGAARALCGKSKGIACILGTGSSSCYFNGSRIARSSPGLGYVLGDEGSGAYLGKKVLQYYLYETFDLDLRARFDAMYITNRAEILENVYKKPLPNRYLASFALFLAGNRGHYLTEKIIEDGLNDFFLNHLCRYPEAKILPVHFVGGVAYGFSDVLNKLCLQYEFQPGIILKNPMEGLVPFHQE